MHYTFILDNSWGKLNQEKLKRAKSTKLQVKRKCTQNEDVLKSQKKILKTKIKGQKRDISFKKQR